MELMVVASFRLQGQGVQLISPAAHPQRQRVRPVGGGVGVGVRCGIAEPSGEPAPMGQKTRYNDGILEKAFMTLFSRKMERFASPSPAAAKSNSNKLWDCDYDTFVDVSRRVMQGRSRLQQQQVVRQVLLSMLPPGAPAQVCHSIQFISSLFFHSPLLSSPNSPSLSYYSSSGNYFHQLNGLQSLMLPSLCLSSTG